MEIEQTFAYSSLQKMDVMELENLIAQAPWFSFGRQVLLEKLYLYGDEVFQTQLSAQAIFLSSRTALYKKVRALSASTIIGKQQDAEPELKQSEQGIETEQIIDVVESERAQIQREWEKLNQEREKLQRERAEFERQRENLIAAEFESNSDLRSSENIEEDSSMLDVVEKEKGSRRVVVAGGDFFSIDDLKSLSPEEDMEVQLKSASLSTLAPHSTHQSKSEGKRAGSIDYSTVIGPDGKVNFNDLAFYTETLGHIYAQQGLFEQAIDVFSKLILLYPQKSAYFAALVKDLKNKSKE